MKKLERLADLKFEPIDRAEMNLIIGGYLTDNTSSCYIGNGGDCCHSGDGSATGQYYTSYGTFC